MHARAAVLSGLSTTGNRTVPPLRHREVHALADDFPRLGFTINGGVESLDQAAEHLESGKLRGVMLGRAAYRNPALLAEVDARFYGTNLVRRFESVTPARRESPGDGTRMGSVPRVTIGSRDSGGTRTEDDRLGSRGSFFALDGTDTAAVCVTRRDVLERYAAYGDAVCAMNASRRREIPQRASHPAAARQGGARARPRREGRGRVSTRVRAGVWGSGRDGSAPGSRRRRCRFPIS